MEWERERDKEWMRERKRYRERVMDRGTVGRFMYVAENVIQHSVVYIALILFKDVEGFQ